jgi:hypothetical protein
MVNLQDRHSTSASSKKVTTLHRVTYPSLAKGWVKRASEVVVTLETNNMIANRKNKPNYVLEFMNEHLKGSC